MYNLIDQISARCYEAANKRGKNTSPRGCISSMGGELNEYWDAIDANKLSRTEDVAAAEKATENDEFIKVYEASLHNTATDELADILITAATWIETAKRETFNFQTERSLNVLLARGAVVFAGNRINNQDDVDLLFRVVYLKMKYNELRQK